MRDCEGVDITVGVSCFVLPGGEQHVDPRSTDFITPLVMVVEEIYSAPVEWDDGTVWVGCELCGGKELAGAPITSNYHCYCGCVLKVITPDADQFEDEEQRELERVE